MWRNSLGTHGSRIPRAILMQVLTKLLLTQHVDSLPPLLKGSCFVHFPHQSVSCLKAETTLQSSLNPSTVIFSMEASQCLQKKAGSLSLMKPKLFSSNQSHMMTVSQGGHQRFRSPHCRSIPLSSLWLWDNQSSLKNIMLIIEIWRTLLFLNSRIFEYNFLKLLLWIVWIGKDLCEPNVWPCWMCMVVTL